MPPAAVASPSDPTCPIQADVSEAGGILHLRLISRTDRAVAVRYTLTLATGGNRATQSGSARLSPHVSSTLLDLHQSAQHGWSGMLNVSVDGGASYRLPIGDTSAG